MLNHKTQRIETYASVPRKARAALKELGCGFFATRKSEEFEAMIWSSYIHSKASVGEYRDQCVAFTSRGARANVSRGGAEGRVGVSGRQ